ncbi:hypothetical protein [Flectobacillus sp. BAB-3569]|uniref:hypothetical protein n=1 Tax=Flectobacillus sp. BAB-3569 TaxID=1509483 RepID=UPI00114018DA|nr:hypothetical protein [Flectobacillus sp. BAB-3569]
MSQTQNTLPEDQFSFEDIVKKVIAFKDLVVANWKLIAALTIFGVITGYLVDILTKNRKHTLPKLFSIWTMVAQQEEEDYQIWQVLLVLVVEVVLLVAVCLVAKIS